MSEPCFRIAHLSDLHRRHTLAGTACIGRRRSREPWLERALEAVSQQGVRLLILTGDLLDVPQFLLEGVPRGFQSPGEENKWLDAARKDYLALRAMLEKTGIPYRVLPGNHDHGPLFADVFPDQGDEFLAGGYRWITFTDHEQEGHRPRRLGDSRHLFNRVLEDADPTPQIHLQHYLFHSPPDSNYPYAYEEAEWLRGRIAASGRVRLVLSGHYHKGLPLTEKNGVIYTTGEALSDAPHRWRIYEITKAGDITMQTHSLPASTPAPVVFLDRDGVINDLAAYAYGPEKMRLIPESASAIRRLNEVGIRTVLVTSQSAIGMGYVTHSVVHMVNEQMQRLLAEEGAFLDALYYTAGAGEDSVLAETKSWPTAKSTLIEAAFAELPLRRDAAVIVGDRWSDMEAGHEAGIPGILVRGNTETQTAAGEAPVVKNLAAAVEYIFREMKSSFLSHEKQD